MKKYKVLSLALAVAMLMTSCRNNAGTGAGDAANTVAEGSAGSADSVAEGNAGSAGGAGSADVTNVTVPDKSEFFSNRDLSGAYDPGACEHIALSDGGVTTDSSNVAIGKNGAADTVTITGEGDYLVSGALSDGMIIVDVDKTEKVQLILNGVDIRSATSAAVYVKSADKVFVTLAEGTENALSNGGSFVAIDDNNIDAAIFSKDDLTLNGTGSLAVNSPVGHGIVSKNELTIASGTYDITASSHGMTGKDSIAIADGTFRITAGEDAIKSDNDDDATMGSIYIFGGDYALSAASDGIQALNEINISGGKILVEKSEEGLEARVINIFGGETDVTSSDDGLNATDKRTSSVTAGASVDTKNDATSGASGDTKNDATSGASADTKNDATSGTSAPGMRNPADFGQGRGFGGSMDEASVNISGGIVRVNAEGDGLDSNGHLAVSGGEIYVAGSMSGGDSALDVDIDAVISGGTVVAAGQSGMAQNFGASSTQGTILVNTQQQNAAGSEIALLDSDGNKLVAWTAEKSYNSVVISCPEIKDGGTYTVRTGGTDMSVTMDGLVYGQGGQAGGHGGGMGGFKGGARPQMPDGTVPDGTKPERPGRTMPDGTAPEMPGGTNPDGTQQPSDESAEGGGI